MDPRLKAYQKQARAVPVPVATPTEEVPAPQPVVRAPQFARFDAPPALSPARPALVKTTVPEPVAKAKPEAKAVSSDKSLRKVAKFLILLGQDEAAKVVRHLDLAQIEALGKEIAGIKKIEPVEAEALLKEFGYIATNHAGTAKGGQAMATAILSQAFGADRAKTILHKAVPQAGERPFTFFAGLEPAVVQALLGHASIRTTARYAQVSQQFVGRAQSPLDVLGTKRGAVLG